MNVKNLRIGPSVGQAFAVTKPSIIGVAMRVYCLGGSELTDDERRAASGSPFLYNQHRDTILDLVGKLESETRSGGR